jgi:hypothetical protein
MKSTNSIRTVARAVMIVFIATAASFGPIGLATAQSAREGAPLRIVSIRPTVFFVRDEGQLLQVAEVVVENASTDAVDVVVGAAL